MSSGLPQLPLVEAAPDFGWVELAVKEEEGNLPAAGGPEEALSFARAREAGVDDDSASFEERGFSLAQALGVCAATPLGGVDPGLEGVCGRRGGD